MQSRKHRVINPWHQEERHPNLMLMDICFHKFLYVFGCAVRFGWLHWSWSCLFHKNHISIELYVVSFVDGLVWLVVFCRWCAVYVQIHSTTATTYHFCRFNSIRLHFEFNELFTHFIVFLFTIEFYELGVSITPF